MPVRYTIAFHGANPDAITITKEKNGKTAETYHYNRFAFNHAGACNCQKFLTGICKKRAELARLPGATPEKIRRLSGACRHETMILQADSIRAAVETALLNKHPDARPSPADLIRVANTVHSLHKACNIQSMEEEHPGWVQLAVDEFLAALAGLGPAMTGQAMRLPGWVLRNQKLLNRAAETAGLRIQTKITGLTEQLGVLLGELQAHLFKNAQNALRAGQRPNIAFLTREFLAEEKPWLAPATKNALAFTATKQIPGHPEKMEPALREALFRFGGKAAQFAEISDQYSVPSIAGPFGR